jgi:mannose-6-phosphate isomerase-like protein (cupin superfamily)
MAEDLRIDRRMLLTAAFGGPAALTLAGLVGIDEAFAGQNGGARPAARTMRRIVTAHDAEGRSVIALDETVPISDVWKTQPDRPIGTVPGDEKLLVTKATGETRFFMAAIPPSGDPKPNLQNRIGFHRTGGVAYCYVINGELVFLVDTKEVRVRAGDVVVERNTMHSWRNEGTEPVVMAITVVTATA